ncbi:MAG TPA: ROK family protein [Vicinamibacteria bacterium]|nr:ROK family protein [Vicinamibacteria bacterium]
MGGATLYFGVDLGGTRLRMAAVNEDGRLASELVSVPTGRDFGPDDLRERLGELSSRLRGSVQAAVAALGFGTAGVVGEGPLTQCDNLPRLNGVDVGALVAGVAGCPVALENDARCFTLAEARFGAGRGARDVVGITLGTGVGCGVMIGGRLHRGAFRQAGEVWRIPLRGRRLEDFVSGAGIVRNYEAKGGAPGLDARRVAEAARTGDAAAIGAWRAYGEDVAVLCETVVTLLDPELIVIGGSIAGAADLYHSLVAARLEEHGTRLVDAELGPAAGVIGAAALNMDGELHGA